MRVINFVAMWKAFCSIYCKIILIRGGPMFVNLLVTRRRNFVGNWFVALQCKTIHYFIKHSLGRKFVGKGTKSANNKPQEQ